MNDDPKQTRDWTCGYCGHVGPDVATHSGIEECRKCWTYRKMDRPAAVHYDRTARDFLGKVDFWDQSHYFPECGMTKEQMSVMLYAAQAVWIRSHWLTEYGPMHKWSDDTLDDFNMEMRDTKAALERLVVTNTGKED